VYSVSELARACQGIIKCGESSQLSCHGFFDFGFNLHAPRVRFGRTFTQNKANSALDIIAFADLLFFFCDYVPGGTNAQRIAPRSA
jgi:hypothetical protein